MFNRKLQIVLPLRQSTFLWGARRTGKSSYLKAHFKEAVYYDLLDTHELARMSKEPHLLREELLERQHNDLVIIDEIQKIPELLNEVHWLIENTQLQFVLCGSSARKLKHSSVNLLGGRAWKYAFYPLSFCEIPEFNLLRALQHGLVPVHYLAEANTLQKHLQAYVDIYLTDEIRNEGVTRQLAAFSRFLDVAGMTNGEQINAANIARDCGIARPTVMEYYQILLDTLLGYFIYPYTKKVKRDLITSMPKFYLFDVGIANYLGRRVVTELKGMVAGRSLEHYIFLELIAYRGLMDKRFEISYWRTKQGLEVDFILGDAKFAIEVKISEQVHKQDLKGLSTFGEEHPGAQLLVISQDKRSRKIMLEGERYITVLPWKKFLTDLWADKFSFE